MKLGSHAVTYLGEHSRQNEKQEERKTGRTPRADFILLLGFYRHRIVSLQGGEEQLTIMGQE